MKKLSNSRSITYEGPLDQCMVLIARLSSYDNNLGTSRAMSSRGIISNGTVGVSSMHDSCSIL